MKTKISEAKVLLKEYLTYDQIEYFGSNEIIHPFVNQVIGNIILAIKDIDGTCISYWMMPSRKEGKIGIHYMTSNGEEFTHGIAIKDIVSKMEEKKTTLLYDMYIVE